MTDSRQLFRKQFAHPPTHIVRAPAALELLGTGDFIPDGLTLAAAVNRYVTIASAPRQDGRIELIAPDAERSVKFWVDDLEGSEQSKSIEVFKSVLCELKRRGVHFTGFSAAIDPGSPGWPFLNWEASLEAATAMTVRCLHPYALTETGVTTPPRPDQSGSVPPARGIELTYIALACQAAAARRGTADTALEDRLVTLHGKAWQLVSLDSQSRSIEWIPIAGEVFVLCRPEAEGSGTGGSLELLYDTCGDAAEKIEVKSLRPIEKSVLESKRDLLGKTEFNFATHVLAELQRVVSAERVLREGDHEQFGQYLLQSHDSARELQLQSNEQLSALVDLARQIPGCPGARALPGRNTTLNLVAHHAVPVFTESLKRRFTDQAGTGIETCACLPVNGAGRADF